METDRKGEYLYLIWEGDDHPEYIRGHVTMEEAQSILNHELGGFHIGSVAHAYMRAQFPSHFCPDGCDREYVEYPEPSRGTFKVTRIVRAAASIAQDAEREGNL